MNKDFFKKIVVFLLEFEARLVLKKYKPRIVAVTGSVGKTSTKDAIYTVLSSSFYVRKSEKSFNSEIGIPLTILGAPNAWSNPLQWTKNFIEGLGLIVLPGHYPHTLVLEAGADRPGDIKHLASWITPDSVVLTRFPDVPVHVEFFESPEHVIQEKLHLVGALKDGGTLVVNFDDEAMHSIGPKGGGSLISYGFEDGADLMASEEQMTYDHNGRVTGVSFRVDYGGSSIPIFLKGVLGRQHIYPVLAALALGISQGLNIVSMGEALKTHTPPPGRMRIIEGREDTAIIDDTYNSSPVAALSALDVLSEIKGQGRRITVLGDMMELGTYTVQAHRDVGKRVAEVADLLYAVGIRSQYMAEAAHKHKMKKRSIHVFDNAREAAEKLSEDINTDDVILVKGSQSMRMERIVEKLMAHPEKREKLLVRQDSVWQKKT